MQLGHEIEKQYELSLSKYSYTEFFNRIRSGNATKLVVIIDEFQFIAKRDEEFFKAVLKLKAKRRYPGPVMIILASSSIAWVEQELGERLGDGMKKINETVKLDDLKFIDMVRSYPEYSVSDCVKAYGILGGVSSYMNRWNSKKISAAIYASIFYLQTGICLQRPSVLSSVSCASWRSMTRFWQRWRHDTAS